MNKLMMVLLIGMTSGNVASASVGDKMACRTQTTALGYVDEGSGIRANYLTEYNRNILGEPNALIDQYQKTAVFYDRNYKPIFHRKYVVTDPFTGYATYQVYEHIRGLDQLVEEGKCTREPVVVVCESEGSGTQARLEYQSAGPGKAKASVIEYQGRSVLVDPFSVFNHMGIYPFRAADGLEFTAYEFQDEFQITALAFGGQRVVTAKGKCTVRD